MKNWLILVQITGYFSITIQNCIQRNEDLTVINNWWRNYGNTNIWQLGYQIKTECDSIPEKHYESYRCVHGYGRDNCAVKFSSITTPLHKKLIPFYSTSPLAGLYYMPDFVLGYKGVILDNIGIRFIEEDVFESLKSLQEISLKENNISVLPDKLFASNANLESIDLSYNNISIILGNSTFYFNSTKNLNLQHNKLQKLNFTLPITLINLELSFNLISQISRDLFFGMYNLTTLSLANNRLTALPIGCFKDLNQLEFLSLANNKIIHLTPHSAFSGLHGILTLNISSNSLEDAAGLITNSLETLTTLDIESNCIRFLDIALITNTLRKLQLIGIDGNIFTCSYLRTVFHQFSDKNVTILPGSEYFNDNIRGITCKNVFENKNHFEETNTVEDKTSSTSSPQILSTLPVTVQDKTVEENISKLVAPGVDESSISIVRVLYTCSVFLVLIFVVLVWISFMILSLFLYTKLQVNKNVSRVELIETESL